MYHVHVRATRKRRRRRRKKPVASAAGSDAEPAAAPAAAAEGEASAASADDEEAVVLESVVVASGEPLPPVEEDEAASDGPPSHAAGSMPPLPSGRPLDESAHRSASAGCSSAAAAASDGDAEDGEEDVDWMTLSSGAPTAFYSGNPHIELYRGELRLFRDVSVMPEPGSFSSKLIAVVAVPGHMTIADFCSYTECMHSFIQLMRVVRGKVRRSYMVLLDMDSEDSAQEFFAAFDSTPYNSMESDLCHVLFVGSMEWEELGRVPADVPPLLVTPPEGAVELPNCAVCLERLDYGVSCILTTMCNHSFHCDCLRRWEDASCPVCRFCLAAPDSPECDECKSTDDLWICLICGYVGCGRYTGEHAFDHFKATSHTYAMAIETQRVWDYAGDGYVHRLVQTKADGKLVPVTGGGVEMSAEDAERLTGKLEAVTLEYNYLLTSQLDKQRSYFESLVEEQTAGLRAQLAELQAKLRATERLLEKEKKQRLPLERALDDSKEAESALREELAFTRQLNDSLLKNQAEFEKRVADKDARIAELEEEVGDLMGHFTAASRIEGDPDLKEGVDRGSVELRRKDRRSAARRKGRR